MSESSIIGILLAAGIGRRFDPAGARLKLLEPDAAGMPLAVAALRNLQRALAEVIVVVRPAQSEPQRQLHALLSAAGARLVVCADADLGMGRSLACGVRASVDASGWLIALADMPAIAPATIAAVRYALLAGNAAAAPRYRGRRGHPVGFGLACREELLALTGDAGARGVLAAHPPLLVDVDDAGCLLDIDTPADQTSKP